MTTAYTPEFNVALFGSDLGDNINANFNEAFVAAEVAEDLPPQDISAVPSGIDNQDEFRYLDFAALEAYQPSDGLRDVAGGEVSAFIPAVKDLAAQAPNVEMAAELARLKALVTSMGVEPPAPPPKTPPPRKRKSSHAANIDISPTKRSNLGVVESIWSPGVLSDDRKTIGQVTAPHHQTFSPSPAAKDVTTPTPARKPAPKKARTPARKRTPAVKKTAQQPQRPKKHRTMPELLASNFEDLEQQEKARLLLPMLQGFDPETGKKVAKAGSMAQELQAPLDPLAEIAQQIINIHSNTEISHIRTGSDSESGIVAAGAFEQVTGWASSTDQQNVGWASPTAEQAVGWQSPAQEPDSNNSIDLNFAQSAQEETAADGLIAQGSIYGTNDDFLQSTEHETAAVDTVAQPPSIVSDSDENAGSAPPPFNETAFAPQTPQAQITSNFEPSSDIATPYDQTSSLMNNSNTATPVEQTPGFQDFLNNGGNDSYLNNAGNSDLFDKSGDGDFFSDADIFGVFNNAGSSNDPNNAGAFNDLNVTGSFFDFSQADNYDMFDTNKSFDCNSFIHTGLTPVASSFGTYMHTGLTPTDANFNVSGHGGNIDATNSFLDPSMPTDVASTNSSFTQPANNGVSATNDPFALLTQIGQLSMPSFYAGSESHIFAPGMNMEAMANAGAARQREALMNFERRTAEGRRR